MKKTFKKQELDALGLPDECEGGRVVSDKIVGTTRWSTQHSLVFQLPGQAHNEAWQTSYQHGSTEQQHEGPWEYEDEIECTLVHETERTVKVWAPKQDPAPDVV